MNDGKTKIAGAHEAADEADKHQPSHWTAGKDNRTESEIAENGGEPRRLSVHTQDGEVVSAETPPENGAPQISEIKQTAAGLPSVVSTMRHSLGKMGARRTVQTLLKVNQTNGFDCPSCAWADPDDDRKIAEFCENGAKAVADEAMTARVTPEFFQKYSVAEMSQESDYWLNRQGRITEPMILRRGATHYEPISWRDAFRLIAFELNDLASPDEAVFYTSGRTSNEAAFLYQLFVRQFGTNNLPDCSNMCHESSGTALTEAIGIGKGTVTLEDFERTDLILILGQNPGTNHPRMMSSLEHAKQNGAKIISVNPLPEAGLLSVVNPNPQEYRNPLAFPMKMLANRGTPLSDLHLPIKIGGDMAFLKGVQRILLDEFPASLDRDFLANKTANFEEFRRNLMKTAWIDIEEQSGLTREQISEAAKFYASANRVISCWAMGLTQHKHAVATIQEIANLHFLRGNIGKPGAGLCPVRGHSNVQGDRTVGIWERPREEFLKALDKEFDFAAPREHGFDTVEAIKAMNVGKAKVFFAMGGNFLSATPDTEYTGAALRKTKLTAQVITKLNRTALICGEQSLILPCLGRTEIDLQKNSEQFVSTENSMGVVQKSKGVLKPASEQLRSEPWIVCEMAKTVLGAKSTVDWDKFAANYDEIRNAIERTIPGFERYNERVRQDGGFYLPNAPREGEFPTATGRANFTVHELPIFRLKEDELVMMTIRSHDQFNTTIYGLEDRYRGIKNGRRVVLMNRQDIAHLNLKTGETVDLTSHFDDGERTARKFVVVEYDIPPKCAATYFPETNVLVPIGSAAERSNTPTSKFVVITVKPHVEK